MKLRITSIVVTGLILAWAVDYFFWDKRPGLAFPIWVIAASAALFVLALLHKRRVPLASGLLLAISVCLSLVLFVRDEPMTRFVAGALSIGLLSLSAASFLWGDWLQYNFRDFIVVYARQIAGVLSKPFMALSKTDSNEGDTTPKSNSLKGLVPFLRGILIALPILAVLTLLLVSADMVFSNRVENLFSFLDIRRLPEYIFRLIFILVLTFIFTGTLLHALTRTESDKAMQTGKAIFPPFLGWIEGSVVLILVNVLFAVFVAIQIRYLFGGQANITETGFTYSEYARRGFNELVMVTILSLMLYLAIATVSKNVARWQKRLFSGLSLVLFGLVLVILFSAFERLHLYEEAYGFTRLRTYTHLFIYWMAALLIGSAVLEILSARRRFALLLMVIAVGFGFTLGITNVDRLIVQRNVERVQNGETFDGQYLNVLSSDAVPAMISLYQSPATDAKVKDDLGADLACRNYLLQQSEPQPWQSITLSEQHAGNLLAENHSILKGYSVEGSDLGLQVKVNGAWQSCYPVISGMD